MQQSQTLSEVESQWDLECQHDAKASASEQKSQRGGALWFIKFDTWAYMPRAPRKQATGKKTGSGRDQKPCGQNRRNEGIVSGGRRETIKAISGKGGLLAQVK